MPHLDTSLVVHNCSNNARHHVNSAEGRQAKQQIERHKTEVAKQKMIRDNGLEFQCDMISLPVVLPASTDRVYRVNSFAVQDIHPNKTAVQGNPQLQHNLRSHSKKDATSQNESGLNEFSLGINKADCFSTHVEENDIFLNSIFEETDLRLTAASTYKKYKAPSLKSAMNTAGISEAHIDRWLAASTVHLETLLTSQLTTDNSDDLFDNFLFPPLSNSDIALHQQGTYVAFIDKPYTSKNISNVQEMREDFNNKPRPETIGHTGTKQRGHINNAAHKSVPTFKTSRCKTRSFSRTMSKYSEDDISPKSRISRCKKRRFSKRISTWRNDEIPSNSKVVQESDNRLESDCNNLQSNSHKRTKRDPPISFIEENTPKPKRKSRVTSNGRMLTRNSLLKRICTRQFTTSKLLQHDYRMMRYNSITVLKQKTQKSFRHRSSLQDSCEEQKEIDISLNCNNNAGNKDTFSIDEIHLERNMFDENSRIPKLSPISEKYSNKRTFSSKTLNKKISLGRRNSITSDYYKSDHEVDERQSKQMLMFQDKIRSSHIRQYSAPSSARFKTNLIKFDPKSGSQHKTSFIKQSNRSIPSDNNSQGNVHKHSSFPKVTRTNGDRNQEFAKSILSYTRNNPQQGRAHQKKSSCCGRERDTECSSGLHNIVKRLQTRYKSNNIVGTTIETNNKNLHCLQNQELPSLKDQHLCPQMNDEITQMKATPISNTQLDVPRVNHKRVRFYLPGTFDNHDKGDGCDKHQPVIEQIYKERAEIMQPEIKNEVDNIHHQKELKTSFSRKENKSQLSRLVENRFKMQSLQNSTPVTHMRTTGESEQTGKSNLKCYEMLKKRRAQMSREKQMDLKTWIHNHHLNSIEESITQQRDLYGVEGPETKTRRHSLDSNSEQISSKNKQTDSNSVRISDCSLLSTEEFRFPSVLKAEAKLSEENKNMTSPRVSKPINNLNLTPPPRHRSKDATSCYTSQGKYPNDKHSSQFEDVYDLQSLRDSLNPLPDETKKEDSCSSKFELLEDLSYKKRLEKLKKLTGYKRHQALISEDTKSIKGQGDMSSNNEPKLQTIGLHVNDNTSLPYNVAMPRDVCDQNLFEKSIKRSLSQQSSHQSEIERKKPYRFVDTGERESLSPVHQNAISRKTNKTPSSEENIHSLCENMKYSLHCHNQKTKYGSELQKHVTTSVLEEVPKLNEHESKQNDVAHADENFGDLGDLGDIGTMLPEEFTGKRCSETAQADMWGVENLSDLKESAEENFCNAYMILKELKAVEDSMSDGSQKTKEDSSDFDEDKAEDEARKLAEDLKRLSLRNKKAEEYFRNNFSSSPVYKETSEFEDVCKTSMNVDQGCYDSKVTSQDERKERCYGSSKCIEDTETEQLSDGPEPDNEDIEKIIAARMEKLDKLKVVDASRSDSDEY